MSKFYWNFLYPTGNRENAYRIYLQNKSHVKDITDCVDHSFESLKSTLKENNNIVAEKISNICFDINSGFSLVNNNLSQINSSIQDLTSEISELSFLLDWNLSQIIEGQKITNFLLGNISNLLKIPDIQKERVYYIEEGLKFLRIGLDNQWDSEYFDDAYSAFKNALEREPKDFVSLSKIGFLHLFTKQFH